MTVIMGSRAQLARLQERTRPVVDEILQERHRQVVSEGWDDAHDDEHRKGEIAVAAACYALEAGAEQLKRTFFGSRAVAIRSAIKWIWPWSPDWWKPKDPRSDLIRAGALIVAEIERLDRQ